MCKSLSIFSFNQSIDFVFFPSNRIQLPNDRPETYLSALPEKIQKTTDLVLCILPNNRKDRYDALKKYMCLDNPVPSQVRVRFPRGDLNVRILDLDGFSKDNFQEESIDVSSNENWHSIECQTWWRNLGCDYSGRELIMREREKNEGD